MLTALKLEDWSNGYPARVELPRWIARLIWATCEGLQTLEMPGGEHVHLGGFDGIVKCAGGDDMVPAGVSAWELSVEADVRGKAQRDFENRDRNPMHLNKPDVTFVFATSRKFPSALNWAESNVGRGWRDVKPLWSSHLQRWFERAPWLASAFLSDLGEGHSGFESLGMVWSAYENGAAAEKLGPGFVIGDRVEVASTFLDWLNNTSAEARKIRISGASHREVLHYLAACIHRQPEKERVPWESRLFAVQTEEAAPALGKLNGSHVILVPGGPAMHHVLRAQERSNCRVVIMDATPDGPVQPAPGMESIRLGPVPDAVWVKSLVRAGFPAEQAARLCQECQCDYEKLRRAAFIY